MSEYTSRIIVALIAASVAACSHDSNNKKNPGKLLRVLRPPKTTRASKAILPKSVNRPLDQLRVG